MAIPDPPGAETAVDTSKDLGYWQGEVQTQTQETLSAHSDFPKFPQETPGPTELGLNLAFSATVIQSIAMFYKVSSFPTYVVGLTTTK